MTAVEPRRRALRRGADHERKTAKAVGSTRTARIGSRRSEPDIAPIRVANVVLVGECKYRTAGSKFLRRGLRQAASYQRGAVPFLVLREPKAPALVVVDLDVFCALTGIAPAALPQTHTATRRDPRQLALLDAEAPTVPTRENSEETGSAPTSAPERQPAEPDAQKGDAPGCEGRERPGAPKERRRDEA